MIRGERVREGTGQSGPVAAGNIYENYFVHGCKDF
jgi:hypothetical protein